MPQRLIKHLKSKIPNITITSAKKKSIKGTKASPKTRSYTSIRGTIHDSPFLIKHVDTGSGENISFKTRNTEPGLKSIKAFRSSFSGQNRQGTIYATPEHIVYELIEPNSGQKLSARRKAMEQKGWGVVE